MGEADAPRNRWARDAEPVRGRQSRGCGRTQASPPLFRSIFDNAYLPYRDPETLRAFLKTIDGFSYDHSERLGDAYEYLLSVLGSQGDAGQFRTPRPRHRLHRRGHRPEEGRRLVGIRRAGTAGFLISSYKHILAANTERGRHQYAHARRQGAARRQLRGIRHIAGYGSAVAGQHVPARLRIAAHPRVRHAYER